MLLPVNKFIEQCAWMFLYMYFQPYRFAEYGSEVDRWIGTFSLNGAKANMCRSH